MVNWWLLNFVQHFERRAIATARHMRQKTEQMMSSIGLPLEKLPGMVQPVRDVVSSSVAGSANVSTDLIHSLSS